MKQNQSNQVKEAADNFFKYLMNHYGVTESVAKEISRDNNVQTEYFTKINYLKAANRVNDLDASKLINAATMSHDIYKNFMHYVAKENLPANIVKLYIDQCNKAGKSLSVADGNGETPLQLAVKYGKESTVLKFVEAGVGVNQDKLDNNSTVLHYCVAYDKVAMIKSLIGKCDFNVKDASHAPAITQALVQGNGPLVEALVAGGTDLTLADKDSGKTILHLLIEAKMFASATLAVLVGYDATTKDIAGVSAMDLIIDAITDGSCPFQMGENLPALEILEVFCDKKNVPLSKAHIIKVEQSSISGKDAVLGAMKNYVKMAEEVEEFMVDPNAHELVQVQNNMEQLENYLDNDQLGSLESLIKDFVQVSAASEVKSLDDSDLSLEDRELLELNNYIAEIEKDLINDSLTVSALETEINTDLTGNTSEDLPH